VICSSYEIIASLTLSEEEFLEIKLVYVDQVIEILRAKAHAEARLLFQEYALAGGRKTLVELSMAVSKQINDVTDIILENLTHDQDNVLKDPLYQEMIYRHCPPILVERYRERLLERLPPAHKIAILSAYIASFIVYREGLNWLDGIAAEARFEAARTYMEQGLNAKRLIEAVEGSDIAEKAKIIAILKRSAARDLTILELDRQVSEESL
jgi:glutamate dehydrogenase